MEYQEIIDIVKDPAMPVAKELEVPSSILIALSVLILDNEEYANIQKGLLDANNPYAIEANYVSKKTKKKKVYNDKNKKLYHSFDSMEEAIANFVTTNETIFSTMKGTKDYVVALNDNDALTDDQKDQIVMIIEEYKLNDCDIWGDKLNIITPSIEVEQPIVNDAAKEIIDAVSEINPEMKKEDVVPVLNLPKTTKSIVRNIADHRVRRELCTAGTKIHVLRTNLYKTIYDKIPTRSITGDYYLYSGVEKYQRYAVVAKKEYVGVNDDLILGYIDYDEFDIIEE